jgi:hypothetical protein
MSEQRLPIHPYAEIFPPMTFPDFDRLCGDIQQNGLQEDIVLLEGKVLDGRSRYLACLARNVEPRFRPYAGECGSPLAFVVARNLHRRHLTESQRALVAARLKPLFEGEARQRKLAVLKQGSSFPVVMNSSQREDSEKRRSVHKAAELMRVSRCSVQAADRVHKQGVEPLVAAVEGGNVSVSAAARIAALPAEEQQAVVAAIASGLKPRQALTRARNAGPAGQAAAWIDDQGQPLPESLIPAFRERTQFDQLCRRIDRVVRAVGRLGKSPAALYLDVAQVSSSLEAASRSLAAARPSRLCPHQAEAALHCSACHGHGWIPLSPAGRPRASPTACCW